MINDKSSTWACVKIVHNILLDIITWLSGGQVARDGPAPHHDPYPKTDAENIASICPSLQINEINISRLPCSNSDRRFLIIFSATPRFSAAGLATFLYDLEFFIWNWRRASMASELGSADPLLDMLAERGVTWPGLPVLLPLPAPSPAPSSLMEQNIFVNNKYFSSDTFSATWWRLSAAVCPGRGKTSSSWDTRHAAPWSSRAWIHTYITFWYGCNYDLLCLLCLI